MFFGLNVSLFTLHNFVWQLFETHDDFHQQEYVNFFSFLTL